VEAGRQNLTPAEAGKLIDYFGRLLELTEEAIQQAGGRATQQCGAT
jgi:hypothetical protein